MEEVTSGSDLSPTRIATNTGVCIAALMLIFSALGWQKMSWITFFSGIYFGMKFFKRELGGIIVYYRALSAGFQSAFFTSFIIAFFAYLNVYFEPSLIETTIETMEQQMRTYGIPAVTIDSVIQQWRGILSPAVIAGATIFAYSATGGLAAILLAFLVRNNKPAENL